jgi:hypothetical protein
MEVVFTIVDPAPHLRHRGLAEMEHREDVRPKDELDLLGRNVEKRVVGHLVAGVVDEHVDRAEFRHRAIDERKAVVTIADVARARDAASSRVLD